MILLTVQIAYKLKIILEFSSIHYSALEGGISNINNGSSGSLSSSHIGVLKTSPFSGVLAKNNNDYLQTIALDNSAVTSNSGLYVKSNNSTTYYSEDNSSWYTSLFTNGLSNSSSPPTTAKTITAKDARGVEITNRPDMGAYESSSTNTVNTVTLDPKGGTLISPKSFFVVTNGNINDANNIPMVTPPTGKELEGWVKSGATTLFPLSNSITSDITLNARYRTKRYDVTFDAKGGKFVSQQNSLKIIKEVEHNTTVSLPSPNPTKDTDVFVGWYTDTATTTKYDFSELVTTNFTLYAKWYSKSDGFVYLDIGNKPVPPASDLSNYGQIVQDALTPYNSGATLTFKYVTTGGTGTKNGSSWENAIDGSGGGLKTTIDGITDASTSKVYIILIAGGTYAPTSTLSMKDNVAIVGGWKSGGGWTRPSSDVTAINGSSNGNQVIFSNTNGINNTALLYGVTITNGARNSGNTTRTGGMLLSNSSSPTINYVTFSANGGTDTGSGAMSITSSSPKISYVAFSGNSGNISGGVSIISSNAEVDLDHVTFSGNTSSSSFSGAGGLNIFNSTTKINYATFSGNTGYAGAINFESADTSLITHSTFSENRSSNGAILIGSSSNQITMVSNIFWNNDPTASENSIQIKNNSSASSIHYSALEGGISNINNGFSGSLSANHIGVLKTSPFSGVLAKNNNEYLQTIALDNSAVTSNSGLYIKSDNSTIYYSEDNSSWYTAFDTNGLSNSSSPPTTAKTLTAKDARGVEITNRPDMGAYESSSTNTVNTVTLDPKRGTLISPKSFFVVTNGNINDANNIPMVTPPTGKELEGWVKSGATTLFPLSNSITSDITLNARYRVKKYNVTFDAKGGRFVSQQNSLKIIKEVEHNTTVSSPSPNPTKDTDIFAGWYTDDTATTTKYNFSNLVTTSFTLYAKWYNKSDGFVYLDAGNKPVPPASDLSNYGQTVQDALTPYTAGATLTFKYVTTGGTGTKNGSSWENAIDGSGGGLKTTIDGITNASTSKVYVILIAGGTYTPTSTLSMKDNVAIVGGFNSSSIISGDNKIQVFNNKNLNTTASLTRLTITKGTSNSASGAMYNDSASVTLTEITFSNNSAIQSGGGAMLNTNSNPILNRVFFSNNSAPANGGGGVYNVTSSPIFNEVSFTSNTSKNGGGGMYNDRNGSNPIILNKVTFSNNSSSNGAGLFNSNSSVVLNAVTFSENRASDYGGGIFNTSNSTTVLNAVTFSSNFAKTNGGAIYNLNSPSTISSAIFWGNSKGDGSSTTPNQFVNSGQMLPVIGHSIIQGATNDTSKGIINTNPDLKSISYNGGNVRNIAIDSDSPAKDKGLYFAKKGTANYYSTDKANWYSTPLLIGTPITTLPANTLKFETDARGVSYNGRPDMGAYEYTPPTP